MTTQPTFPFLVHTGASIIAGFQLAGDAYRLARKWRELGLDYYVIQDGREFHPDVMNPLDEADFFAWVK